MKNILFFAFLMSLLSTAQGSHLLGGEITWECAGNGGYVFSLYLYRDCNGAINPTSIQKIKNDAGLPDINCAFAGTTDMSIPCYDPQQSISCQAAEAAPIGINLPAAVSRYRYISDTVYISITPPASGIGFYYSTCCRPASNRNGVNAQAPFYIQSKLFATTSTGGCLSDSPEFLHSSTAYISNDDNSNSHLARVSGTDDSLYYELVEPLTSDSSTYAFLAGYSPHAPFPDQTEGASNGPITFDNSTGQLSYNISNGTEGWYTYGVLVQSWVNGTLHSQVLRDGVAYYKSVYWLNNTPAVILDTTGLNVQKINDRKFIIHTFPGDSVYFEMNSIDANQLPNGTSHSIAFMSYSEVLDTANGGMFYSVPVIFPVFPQTGFTAIGTNSIGFIWNITQQMINVSYPKYQFLFRFRDNACPFPHTTDVIVEIQVHNAAEIFKDSLKICQGDSVQLSGQTGSGNYLWFPNTEIDNVQLQNPKVAPSLSRYYYLEDPQNTGMKDSVYIEVQPKGTFTLQHNNGIISTGGTAAIDLNIWFYNGLPIALNRDSVSVIGPGMYYAQGIGGICHYWSDTLNIQGVTNLVNFTPLNGKVSTQQIQLDSSLGFNFQLVQNFEGMLDSIYLIGVSSGKLKRAGDSVAVKLYDTQTQAEIFTYSFQLNNPLGELVSIPVGIFLNEQVSYTLALSGDTGIYIYTYENVNYPSYPFSGNLQIDAAVKGSAMQFPGLSSANLPAVVFRMENSFSLKEGRKEKINMYPNPVGDNIWIHGLAPDEHPFITISDMQGRKVLQTKYSNGGVNISSLASGFYSLQISSKKKVFRMTFVKE